METWFPLKEKYLKVMWPFISEFNEIIEKEVSPYKIEYEIHGNLKFSRVEHGLLFEKEHSSRASWLFNLTHSRELNPIKEFLQKKKGDFFNFDLVIRAKIQKNRIGPIVKLIIKPIHSQREAEVSIVLSRRNKGIGPNVYIPDKNKTMHTRLNTNLTKKYLSLIVEEDITAHHKELWRPEVHKMLRVNLKELQRSELRKETSDFVFNIAQALQFIHNKGYCYGDRVLPHLYYDINKKDLRLIDYGGTFETKNTKKIEEMDLEKTKKDLHFYLVPDKAAQSAKRKMYNEITKMFDESYELPII